MSKEGYLYCISIAPDIVKIGKTSRNPLRRLHESNKSEFEVEDRKNVLEFAKKVKDYAKKERLIHKVLHYCRVVKNREIFKIEVEKVRDIFDLMDGEYWCQESLSGTVKEEVKQEVKEEVKEELKHEVNDIEHSNKNVDIAINTDNTLQYKNPYKYNCETCKLNTNYKNIYDCHMKSKTHHEKIRDATNKTIYTIKCKICGKTYKTACGLWKHKSKCIPIKPDVKTFINKVITDALHMYNNI